MHAEVALRDASGASPNFALGENILAGGVDARTIRLMSEDASISLPFADRHEAGRILAIRLTGYAHQPDVIVLGLARGGVPGI